MVVGDFVVAVIVVFVLAPNYSLCQVYEHPVSLKKDPSSDCSV